MTIPVKGLYDGPVSGALRTRLKIASWNEVVIDTYDDSSKLTRADVVLSDGADALTSGVFHSIMFYRADGTSTYSTLMRLEATLDERSGSITLIGEGTYDGTTASGHFHSIEGSGTDDLHDITCDVESVATHADYPFMPLSITYHFG